MATDYVTHYSVTRLEDLMGNERSIFGSVWQPQQQSAPRQQQRHPADPFLDEDIFNDAFQDRQAAPQRRTSYRCQWD